MEQYSRYKLVLFVYWEIVALINFRRTEPPVKKKFFNRHVETISAFVALILDYCETFQNEKFRIYGMYETGKIQIIFSCVAYTTFFEP